jgi:protein TonB
MLHRTEAIMLVPLAFLVALQPLPPTAATTEPITGSSARLGAGLNRYYSADDYPAAALRYEAEGIVRFRLNILPTGRVGACTITASSGHERLDSATCRILTSRVRYRPARPGGPIAGTDLGWVRYVITPGLRRPQPNIVYTH